jgi:hypothetical protein
MNNNNNAIIATIFVAMMMASGLAMGFTFITPQDSLVFEKATGVGASDGMNPIPVGGSRR